MEYNKKFVLKNEFSQGIFDFDYFVKNEYVIEFYKNGSSVFYLSLDENVKVCFQILHRTEDSTLILFSIKKLNE